MAASLCLFADDGYRQLLPLTYTRPVYHLRCGTGPLSEKILSQYAGDRLTFHCRPELVGVFKNSYSSAAVNQVIGDSCLLDNGRLLGDQTLAEKIPMKGPDCLYTCGDSLVAARISGRNLEGLRSRLNSGPLAADLLPIDRTQEVDVTLITYSWNLIHSNGDQIKADWDLFGNQATVKGQVAEEAILQGRENIFIDQGAMVKPGVVLDAEGGHLIGSEAKIFPNATIEGPAFIGPKTLIKIGAKIYEGTTIGEVCKVGGEVEESIIHSYSNKQHDGFLGHAYMGKWVNLGADTNNSDLKNNYGHVKVYVDDALVDTGSLFVNLTMGDHSKSCINTMFNTGTLAGVCCNVFGGGFPPKFIPSFSWGGSEGMEEYRLDKSLETARAVMGRRKIVLTQEEEELFKAIFEETPPEREMLK